MQAVASPELGTPEVLLTQAGRALAVVRAAGADEAEIRVARRRGLDLEWRDGRLEKVSETAERSLSASVYVDGRYSTHVTNDLEPARLERFLREAVALTRLLEPDPFRRIPEPALFAGRPTKDLDLVDPRLAALSREQRVEACRAMHDRAREDASVISATSHFSDDHTLSARVTSNGFSGSREATSVGYGATVTIREGEDKKPEDHWYVAGTHLQGLPSADAVGREALRRVLARRGAAQAESRRATMVVHPEAASSLIGRLLGALTAGAVQQKRSFLAGRQGQRVGSAVLSMADDPLLERGLASRTYDAEGISARRLPLLEDGVLRDFYVDTYYGRKLGWAPTTCSPSNVVFRHGTKDLAGLLQEAGEGILVTSWLGGNANGTTGDFSFGLRGHVIRGGRAGEPIAEMNVTGNYLDLLQHLVAVGNDPVPWYSCRTPTLVFEGVQFSGR